MRGISARNRMLPNGHDDPAIWLAIVLLLLAFLAWCRPVARAIANSGFDKRDGRDQDRVIMTIGEREVQEIE